MLLGEILKQKRAGAPISRLLSGEKQSTKAQDLSRNVLDELRLKLWLVVPEQYEVTCECCRRCFSPFLREGSLATCEHCHKKTVLDDAPIGTQWIRFNQCLHVTNVERGNQIDACSECGARDAGPNGRTYTVCSVAVPKKIDNEIAIRDRVIQDIKQIPYSVFPDKFVVTCIWKGCNKKFIPICYDNYCVKCPGCGRPNPTVEVEHHKWIYYRCSHLHLLKSGSIPDTCPKCGMEVDPKESSLANPKWNLAVAPSNT